jgi:thioredoxin reductase (NADPH)
LSYDCIIIGGGIAGLQAAIQLGRYNHQVLVIDSKQGRSLLCRSYHNLLGWPNGVSGQELRQIGRNQAEKLGVQFIEDEVSKAESNDNVFLLSGIRGSQYKAKRLLLATGIMDRIPVLPGILPCLGISVYVCPDCDGYEITNQRTLVLGSGNVGAQMALTLLYWTRDLVYINHEQAEVDADLKRQLRERGIPYVQEPIQEILSVDAKITGIILRNGRQMDGDRGFIAFGGNSVKSALAKQLGVELLENKHIVVNARTKMTNTVHVWAAGDVVAHSEQVTIAMGEGSQAAIWIHKSLIGDSTGGHRS